MKACAILLVPGSLLLLAGFLVHPEESPSNDEYRATVAAHEAAARLSHQLIFGGLVLVACAALTGAFASFREGASTGHVVGPIAAAIGAIVSLPLVAIEGTVLPTAAAAGDAAAFNAWSEVGYAFIPGFLLFAAGLASIAFADGRSQAGAMRIVSFVAGGLACLALVGMVGAFYAGIWAFNVLSIAFLGVLAYLAIGGSMELLGKGHAAAPARPARN